MFSLRHVARGQVGRAGGRQVALLRVRQAVSSHARDVQVLVIDQGRAFDTVSRDYYLGGLDDMAAWTSLVWEQAAVALSGGTQVRLLLELNTKPIHDPPPAIGL